MDTKQILQKEFIQDLFSVQRYIANKKIGRTDKVSLLIALNDDVTSVEQHFGAFLSAAVDKATDALLRLRTDERTEVRSWFLACSTSPHPVVHMGFTDTCQAILQNFRTRMVNSNLAPLSISWLAPGTLGSTALPHRPR